MIYDGIKNPPKLDRNSSIILVPIAPNAQHLHCNRTINYRLHYLEGHVQLTLKIEALEADQIIVTNQLGEKSDREFIYFDAVIEGVYLQLLLGKTNRDLDEEMSKPYRGAHVTLLDVQEYYSNYPRVKIATIATIRQALMNETSSSSSI